MKFSVKVVLFVAALAAFASARVAPLDSALRSATSKENSSVKVFDSRSAAEVRPIKSTIIRALSVSPEILKISALFFLWYSFNAGYNVFNQYLKQDLQYPMTNAALQLLVGMLYAVPLWVLKLRKLPNLNKDDFLKLLPVVVLNTIGHTVTMIAMFEKGGGSFTHVIKAAEPVVTVLLNFLVCKLVPKPWTAASLLPVTYGVAYASTLGKLDVATMGKEFTTTAAKMAMTSNFAFSMRSIVRKGLTKDFKARTNLDPSNEHALTTLLSFLLLLPVALLVEKPAATIETFRALANPSAFLLNLFVCGMCYFLYNDVQNVVLGQLGPVPTAVGNTLKRVAIFVALYLFIAGETFPPAKVLGSAIAIAGCLAYAVCDSKKI